MTVSFVICSIYILILVPTFAFVATAHKLVAKLPTEGLVLDPSDLNLPTIVVEALSDDGVVVCAYGDIFLFCRQIKPGYQR